MALSAEDFAAGKLSTAETFNQLKTLIDTEVNSTNRREQGYVIVNDAPKESIDYASQTNNLIGALNQIKKQYSEVLKDETLIAPWLELYTRIELLRTAYPNKVATTYPDNAGCGAACTGLCSGCTNQCTSCTSCSGSCSGGCYGECKGCEGTCWDSCYDWCRCGGGE